MDPSSQKIIPRQANSEKKPQADCRRRRCSPTSISAALSDVLDSDDLLPEILLRVGFPTALVRAALVCRRWLHHASDPSFLRRFRKLHPPRLLGFYVNHHHHDASHLVTPYFAPMLPQAPELAAIIHRASSILDTDRSNGASRCVLGCRNGSVIIIHREDGGRTTFRVHDPLSPERAMSNIIAPSAFSQLPSARTLTFGDLLSKEEEEGSGLSYLCVLMYRTVEWKQTACFYTLQDGVMRMRYPAIDQIPPLQPCRKSVLTGNKIYIAAGQLEIFVLDLISSSFSIMQLPQGVEHGTRNTMLSRSDDHSDGLYLAHVKGLRLCMWLHKLGDWLLVDTICLREVCTSLSMLDDYKDSLLVNHVGDNGEFVFLEMGRCALFWDVKRKTVRKVYEMTNEDQSSFGHINSFMMIWPPTFPMLKDDLARTEVPPEE